MSEPWLDFTYTQVTRNYPSPAMASFMLGKGLSRQHGHRLDVTPFSKPHHHFQTFMPFPFIKNEIPMPSYVANHNFDSHFQTQPKVGYQERNIEEDGTFGSTGGEHQRHLDVRRSRPNVKYGPYTCPKCRVVFHNGHIFAAHAKEHYKNESRVEKKTRRQGKFKSKDLQIVRCGTGITVMPRSLLTSEGSSSANVMEEMATNTIA
ncbi:hypothetical protein KSS87_016050 [Heliosperma pusillum]|nr:hypothetical protein KSS87_016050 [Heliosperma pusillum]